jgi:diguanylate cyclase (GGDEF)-like protein
LKRIRDAERADIRNLPVIIVTGAEDDDGSKQIALGAGASDFITKPFESVQLLARAKAQAQQQQTRQALQASETSNRRLEQQNSTDALTGLGNQRRTTERLEEALSYARRHNDEMALLLVQIEKYKALYLRAGKQAAEDVLRRTAGLLCEGRRREDSVTRCGLDTFAIILPSAGDCGAQRVAAQLLDTIRAGALDSAGASIPVRASVATVSPAIDADTSAAGLLEEARHKLRLAAEAGGNRIQGDLSGTANAAVVPSEPAPQAPLSAAGPGVADSVEVETALRVPHAGQRAEADAAALVRAVMPLLHAWDQACDRRHAALLRALEAALDPDAEASLARPADSR